MSEGGNSASRTGRVRRHQVASACRKCQSLKVKCSGQRPTCSRCEKRNYPCVYEVEKEGTTRSQHLREQVSKQSEELVDHATILNGMKHGPMETACELLARWRSGDTIEELSRSLHGTQSHLQALDDAIPSFDSHDAAVVDPDQPFLPMDACDYLPLDSSLEGLEGPIELQTHDASTNAYGFRMATEDATSSSSTLDPRLL